MWPKTFAPFGSKAPESVETTDSTSGKHQGDSKEVADVVNRDASSIDDHDEVNEEAQEGVRRVEATTLIWNKYYLFTVLILIWFIYFTNAFQYSITGNLSPYVLSGFESHSLVPAIYIASNVIAGSLRLVTSRILDLWGRPQGFVIMVAVAVLGLILMATTTNVATFAAAQVFYSLGLDGLIYTVDVVTADASSLKNRALAYAFTSSPYIITAFAGPKAAEGFYENNWRWGFGAFCIILPFVAAPLFGILIHNQHKAKKAGLLPSRNSGRTVAQSIWFYIIEFDALGVFLFATGFCLFLLPFSLADSAPNGWQTGYIIAMIVLGGLLIITFALVEKFVVPKPFLPWDVLTDRTVLGTLLLCWSYQVVHNLGISQAGYVSGVWDVVGGIWCFFVGILVRKTGHFKWLLMAAVPLDILGTGLLIYFRSPRFSVGYVIMCQVFIAFSGGTIILLQQTSIMAAVDHTRIAAVLALLGLFGYMGGAIGSAISGAIWTNTVPQALEKYLPEYALVNATDIYGSLEIQLSYPIGDEVRDAIIKVYGIGQRNMCIAGLVVMIVSLLWVAMIRDINVKTTKQTKGVVL